MEGVREKGGVYVSVCVRVCESVLCVLVYECESGSTDAMVCMWRSEDKLRCQSVASSLF